MESKFATNLFYVIQTTVLRFYRFGHGNAVVTDLSQRCQTAHSALEDYQYCRSICFMIYSISQSAYFFRITPAGVKVFNNDGGTPAGFGQCIVKKKPKRGAAKS